MPRTRPGTSPAGAPVPSPSGPGGPRPHARSATPGQSAAVTQLWGTRPGRLGVFAVLAAALLGMVITVLAGREPGLILGIFLIAGTIVAALAVRPRATYLIFPVPAPAYAVAALVAGIIHDHGADTSRTALVLNAGQWIAAGFIPMTVATALAVLIAGFRWLRNA
jgi:hypothetical protein